MVLHADRADPGFLSKRRAPFRGDVIGVGIHRHDPGIEAEQLAVKLQIPPVIRMRCRLFEVAHMLGNRGLPVLQQAKRRFQLGAHGQHGRRALEARRQRHGRGRIAAGAAQQARHTRHHPRDAIVEAVHDIAVVHQEVIGDGRKPLARLRIIDALRLVAAIAGGQHNRPGKVFHQEMVERRIGQHEAQRRLAGGNARGKGRCIPSGLR